MIYTMNHFVVFDLLTLDDVALSLFCFFCPPVRARKDEHGLVTGLLRWPTSPEVRIRMYTHFQEPRILRTLFW